MDDNDVDPFNARFVESTRRLWSTVERLFPDDVFVSTSENFDEVVFDVVQALIRTHRLDQAVLDELQFAYERLVDVAVDRFPENKINNSGGKVFYVVSEIPHVTSSKRAMRFYFRCLRIGLLVCRPWVIFGVLASCVGMALYGLVTLR